MKKSDIRNTDQGRKVNLNTPAARAARARRLVQKRKPRCGDGPNAG